MRTIIIILILVTQLSAAYNLVEFSISSKEDLTTVKIFTDGRPDATDSVLTNPDRLVVSFKGGIDQFKTDEFNSLPAGLVISFRSTQVSEGPGRVARVVMDIADTPGKYTTETVGDGFVIKVPTPGYPRIEDFKSGRKTEIPKAPSEMIVREEPPVETREDTLEKIAESQQQIKTPTTPAETTATPDGTPPTETNTQPAEPVDEQEDHSGKDLPDDFVPPSEMEGELVADTLEDAYFIRERIVYEKKIDRDPFVQVSNAPEVTIGKPSNPSIENISLVGIVGSFGDYTALLQDTKGFGYMVEIGDSVINGLVTEVSDSSVTFKINEYGYIRDVTMPLKRTLK